MANAYRTGRASEYVEEWLLVIDGTLVLRTPDGEHTLERGDLVCFPPGPGGAHKLMKRSESPARTLMFSSSWVPAVSVNPDSDKIGVFPGNEAHRTINGQTCANTSDQPVALTLTESQVLCRVADT
jgi:uncharacterized cupin superfamily protein